MKRIAWFCAVALLLSLPAAAEEAAPSVSAAAGVVMEAESGELLWSRNAEQPMLVASTTKILTALVALESCDPDEPVLIQPEWTGIEGSSMYLTAGDCLTVRELLCGMLLVSGNDAAVALACHSAGSVEAFAQRMNEKAAALGCTASHFVNPNGLDDAEHYSCALDLARITRQALQNETFRVIVSTREASVGQRYLHNHNKLLGMCEGVFGVKTGYTKAAGRSLVSCCERDGMTLICVTLSAPDDWNDHIALYDWAYDIWRADSVLPSGASFSVPLVGAARDTVRVCPGGELCALRRADALVRVEYELPRFVFAGVRAGETVGAANAYVGDRCVASVPLVFAENAETAVAPLSGTERLARFLGRIGRSVYSF